MSTAAIVSLIGMAAVVGASAVINFYGAAAARSTSDFLIASRTVTPTANAAAISGEYLSAAAFLGVAGLIMQNGADALWYPVGFTAGYLALLLFVAAPLRRSGAYTVSDFATARLGSATLRQVCTVLAILIGWLYMVPQLQGAGLTVATVTTMPSWSGAVAASLVVLATVLFGGMRSMTLVQAFQYFLKLFALALPAVVLITYFAGDDRAITEPASTRFATDTVIDIRTAVDLEISTPVTVRTIGRLDGVEQAGPVLWEPGIHRVSPGASLTFAAGTPIPVPVAATHDSWIAPSSGAGGYPLWSTYSLMIALMLGTMGLPSVLARFYTNPDGRAARRTAVVALALVGAFYLLPILLGALSRLYTPQLLISGETDAAVLLLPSAALGSGWTTDLLTGLIATGAWAAFLSTATGLAVNVAGVIHTDVLRRGRARSFRLAAVIAATVPLAMALLVTRLEFAQTVSLAFAVAASTFCPLLLLGIWWRGLTDRGAIAGLVVGGTLSGVAVIASIAGLGAADGIGVLFNRPALITAPAAFLTMIIVSRRTVRRLPADADEVLLRLHAPEQLGFSKDRPARPGLAFDK